MIIGDDKQKETLYKLLSLRQESISHTEMPTYSEHCKFVDNHPYKTWYLINKEDITIGSFYIKYDNSVGLNIIEHSEFAVENIISFINDNFVPNAPIKSMIPPFFYVNVASENRKLNDSLKALGNAELQISYKLG